MRRPGRKSDLFFLAAALGAGALLVMFAHAQRGDAGARPAAAERAGLVERLGLTDLCLFNDARYARHPAMADRHAAFQDGPMSMEHFPSGALIRPPEHLRPR